MAKARRAHRYVVRACAWLRSAPDDGTVVRTRPPVRGAGAASSALVPIRERPDLAHDPENVTLSAPLRGMSAYRLYGCFSRSKSKTTGGRLQVEHPRVRSFILVQPINAQRFTCPVLLSCCQLSLVQSSAPQLLIWPGPPHSVYDGGENSRRGGTRDALRHMQNTVSN